MPPFPPALSPAQVKRLRDALLGTDPDVPHHLQPLSWLRSLVAVSNVESVAELIVAYEDDPSSWNEMVANVRRLVDGINEALNPPEPTEDAVSAGLAALSFVRIGDKPFWTVYKPDPVVTWRLDKVGSVFRLGDQPEWYAKAGDLLVGSGIADEAAARRRLAEHLVTMGVVP